MKRFTVGKEIEYIDGAYSDCINRWEIKRISKKLFPAGTEMRKLKITYLGKQTFGYVDYNIYKVVSAEGVCRFVGLYYNSYEGGFYYELEEK